MTRVPSLFYSTDTDKQTLHRRIVPNAEQQKFQQERWNDLCDFLIEDLNEKTGCPMYSWLQGSYKFFTQTRPVKGEMDIDLGIYFGWSGEPEDGNFSPLNLKKLVQESLFQYADEAKGDAIEVIEPPKTRCCRIRFSQDFHIDVPSYHLDPERDKRSLATEEDKWEASDPKALYLWFREKFNNEDSTQVRRLIRYLKIWSALNLNEVPSSIVITVLVSESYLELGEKEIDGDDIALKSVCNKILTRLESGSNIPNPVDFNENLNRLSEDGFEKFLTGIKNLLDIAKTALEAPSDFESAQRWSELFLHFFPFPDLDSSTAKNFSLMPIRFLPEVAVNAVSLTNPHFPPFKGINGIGPIPRKCKIYFKLINSDKLPEGARVFWTVRNEDEEAEFKNDLGHSSGSGFESVEEHSAYKGTHYMDVIVLSIFKEVLGFRRIPVKIDGTFVPPRNPKKPWYTRNSRKRR